MRDLLVPGEIEVIAIVREGQALMPGLGTELCSGDSVYLCAHMEAMDRLEALLGS